MRRKRTIWLVPLILTLLIAGYGFFEARSLITGPIIKVTYPTPGVTIEGPTYEISGTVANVAHLSLNGQPITTDLSGAFLETRVTPNGIGTVLLEAEDRFGRVKQVRFDIWGRPGPAAGDAHAYTPTTTQDTDQSLSDI